jgi:hypothetical protein
MARKKPGDGAKPRPDAKVEPELPEPLRRRLLDIVSATDRFCDEHLDVEYRGLCRELAIVLGLEGFSVTSGKAEGWAAGVAYTIGWVNFLGDPSQPHHMKAEDMAHLFGVSEATLMSRARLIREGLGLSRLIPRWTVASRLEDNPLAWLVQDRSGLILDLREAPRHIQEEAVRRGLIPFVPGRPPAESEEAP